MSRIRVDDLHKKWMKDAKYRREYKALQEEFSLVAPPDSGTHPRRPHPGTGQTTLGKAFHVRRLVQ